MLVVPGDPLLQENARILTPSAKKVSNRLFQIVRIRMIAPGVMRSLFRFKPGNRLRCVVLAVQFGFRTAAMMSDS